MTGMYRWPGARCTQYDRYQRRDCCCGHHRRHHHADRIGQVMIESSSSSRRQSDGRTHLHRDDLHHPRHGLPTTANYIVVSSLMAPVVVSLASINGIIVPLIAVHMFVFYFRDTLRTTRHRSGYVHSPPRRLPE